MNDIIKLIVSLGQPFSMLVFMMLIGGSIAVIAEVSRQLRKYGCHRSEVQLKRDLVERGLSVEEIERVIAATSPAERKSAKA